MSDIQASLYEGGWALTLSDTTNDPAGPFQGLFTGSGGTIKLQMCNGQPLALTNVAAGVVLPLGFLRAWSTGTGASGIYGLKVPGQG
jgi:hypothetical protein